MHTIRLRHPWQCEPRGEGCCWVRSFNWPAGLLPQEVAWLVIEALPAGAVVALSGKQLVAMSTGRFDISESIASYNQITIEVPDVSPSEETECPWDVRLEIVEGR